MEGHTKWYKQKLKNSNSLLLINEYDGQSAGLVRFEVEEDHSVIGILIAKEQRGKGLSYRMLIKSVSHYFDHFNQPVLAYIKETNEVLREEMREN